MSTSYKISNGPSKFDLIMEFARPSRGTSALNFCIKHSESRWSYYALEKMYSGDNENFRIKGHVHERFHHIVDIPREDSPYDGQHRTYRFVASYNTKSRKGKVTFEPAD